MKKTGLMIIITLAVISTVFSQNETRERRNPREEITVEGTLQLHKGIIAVASGETIYMVPMLNRYIGFIEGLKEGNSISIEGFAYKNFLHPTKTIINGKTYDFPVMGFAQRERPGFGFGQRQREEPRQMQRNNRERGRMGPRHFQRNRSRPR